jgi:hypothetical protein
VLAHTGVTEVNPTISDTQGAVEIVNQETVNVDFFNSHVQKSEKKKDEMMPETDQCSQSCFHMFTSMEIGEMISCFLLAYLLIANWGRLSLWGHKKWIKMKEKSRKAATALEEANALEEEKRIQACVDQRVAGISEAGGSSHASPVRVSIS